MDWLPPAQTQPGLGIQPATQVCALDRKPNPKPFGPQAHVLIAKPNWPGQENSLKATSYILKNHPQNTIQYEAIFIPTLEIKVKTVFTDREKKKNHRTSQ